jgi:3-(3-hydroxy-phenyl)propionate hydroxylase
MGAQYAFRASPDQQAGRAVHHRVIIVGAGPVGLSLALDLNSRGIEAVVLEAGTSVSTGSRAICYAKRSLEILDRLGVGQRMLDKGVTWRQGKVFWRERMVYQFDLLPEAGHRMPAFVNCQQYYLEQFLIERALELGIDLRLGHRVTGVAPEDGGVGVEITTPVGDYALRCDWLLACDGARSTVRRALGLGFEGQVFKDKFLITDVRMEADFPPERWFWFDPPFHPGQSALLHSQPDQIWRIDLQLGWQAEAGEEVKPERVIPRLRAMLGKDRRFELEWISIYTFRCRRLLKFRHGRVLFLGDAAHEVSPFGARGFNSGIQDADNLAWKLACVLRGLAPERLLDSYDEERLVAADDNIRHSTRSTEFITPKNAASRAYRDAVLALAEHYPFARRMLNSGRLSTPTRLDFSSLNTPDPEGFAGGLAPGSPAEDAPLAQDGAPCWLLNQLSTAGLTPAMTLLLFLERADSLSERLASALARLVREPVPIETLLILTSAERAPPACRGLPAFVDVAGLAAARYAAAPGTCCLIRPDQHVCARWRRFDADRVRAAARRVLQGEAAPVKALAEG